MTLTENVAVIRRLIISTGPATPDRAPGRSGWDSTADLDTTATAVVRAFGLTPATLPVRTVIHLGAGPTPAPAPAGTTAPPARTASTGARSLRHAHRELLDGSADLALVAAFDEPAPGSITVYALKRAAEAVADGDQVLGVLDPAGTDPDVSPALRPLIHGRRETDPERPRLILWSGRDEADETRVRGELLPYLDTVHCESFPSLPTAVPCGTDPGPVRGAAVAAAALASGSVHRATPVAAHRPRPVALLFPGQGSQHHAMAAGLYRREPTFTAAFDAALTHMGPDAPAIRADWLTESRPGIDVDDVRRAQPLLFAVDYALGRMVLGWGVRPVALLGHSAGELVAATLAGVVPLQDAARMVTGRVEEAVKIPPGGMLAVAANEERLRPYLTAEVSIAAVNANQQVMLAGSQAPLDAVESRLRADGLTVVKVPATSPFHSPAMAPASDALERAYAAVPLREPSLPLYSGYTGGPMAPEDALSPRYWARQVTDTVQFLPALDSLLAADDVTLLECGPRQTLTAFARRHRAVRIGASAAVPLLPARPGTEETDRRSVLDAAARLWTEGHQLRPDALARLWTWSDRPVPAATAPPHSLAAAG